NVIMGANIGTTVTSWLLSLTGIESDNLFVQLLKPSSFTPILALVGIILTMFTKNQKNKDIGLILLGFSTLMFGMETMSGAVEPLKDVPEFRNILIMFKNPVLGVLAGAVLTAVIQSSSASVGILQALCATGQITFGSAIPIIMGQNIGTCVTALISSVGANKGAKRAAVVHLCFNIGGTVIGLTLFSLLNMLFQFSFMNAEIGVMGIAVVHTAFNVFCTAIFFPFTKKIEKLACLIVRDDQKEQKFEILDTRLYQTPAVALNNCSRVVYEMAEKSVNSVKDAFSLLSKYDKKLAENIELSENEIDEYEDKIANYLLGLSSLSLTEKDSLLVSKYLHIIGDLERLSDHAVNLMESALEIYSKKLTFSDSAKSEMSVMINAVDEILNLTLNTIENEDLVSAGMVEPLEEIIDILKVKLKKNHVSRLQNKVCTVEMGFVLSDITTCLERISDHCSNVALCFIEISKESMGLHEQSKEQKTSDPNFQKQYDKYYAKYIEANA
ncbi:MAG: Na/Pi cotransporter family protein, partial [Acutalibacteraceae bacterium]